jgi:hypothetical protein
MPAFLIAPHRVLTTPRRLLPRGVLDLVVQFAIVFTAYEVYRLTRGAIDNPHVAKVAFGNADWIVRLERALHLDVEHGVQRLTERVWGLSDVASFLYINVQTTVTFSVMAFIYLRHTHAFGFVRNAFVVTWAVALVGFVLVPTAPPRLLPGLGLHDSVAAFTGVNPNARHITKFYNPYAAVPSLHVGIATLVGLSMSRLSVHRPVRIAWACYPLLVTFVVLATGNHYLFDAVAGMLTAGVGTLAAFGLGRLRPRAWRFRTDGEGRRRAGERGTTSAPGAALRGPRGLGRTVRALVPTGGWPDRARDGFAAAGLTRRSVMAAPIVALLTLVAALVATRIADVPFRDPDHVAAKYVVLVGFGLLLMVTLDIAVRAAARTGRRRPTRAAMGEVRRERWGRYRAGAAGTALLSFYVSYLSYGNVKSVVPLLRPGDLFDRQLADVDRALFLGHAPGDLLHSALGTGFQTQILSSAYVAFIVFLPLSLTVALVFARSLRGGLFVATALSANWLLGAATYVLLPALGPVYAFPAEFSHLPASAVTHLQAVLMEHRVAFLRAPDAAGGGQAIAAFASLHASMTFTAALAAQLLGVGRRLRITLWVVFAVTLTGTIYLGWHYAVDDLAGVGIALCAVAAARGLTGIDLGRTRRMAAATAPADRVLGGERVRSPAPGD